MRLFLPVLLALLPLAAVARTPEWLGPEPHLVAEGSLGGQPLAIRFPAGLTAAALTFEARRIYRPGHAGWRHSELEVSFQGVTGDEETTLRLVLRHDDLLQVPAPATFDLVEAAPPERTQASLAVLTGGEEEGSWIGMLTLGAETGPRDADWLLLGGTVGGTIEATRGEDRLSVSFTAPATGYSRED